MFSIVATETSVLTFISIPGIAYRGDWTFLQLALGYIIGRIFVSIILIPMYFKYGIISIYEILAKKFGKNIQKLASFTFLITRLLADGVRFAAIAIVIQAVTEWSIPLSILIVGIITLTYTVFGGLRTVIQIDALQFFIYLFSAIICIVFLFLSLDVSPSIAIDRLIYENKFRIFDFEGDIFKKPFMFFSAILGGAMLSFSSHGADYMMVQRVLATKNVSSARKAMIGSGFFVFIQFSIFLFIGSLIYLSTNGVLLEKDSEISYVIINFLPVGFKGIVIAGILSVAMSTLSSSINSLTSSTVNDWFPNLKSLKSSRIISIFWTILLTFIALIFINPSDSLVIIGLKIASFTYGTLLSFFILSILKIKFRTLHLFIGYLSGIITVFYFIKFQIAWTFYIIGSVIVNLSIVLILEKFKRYFFIKDIIISILLFSLFPLFSSFYIHDVVKTKIINFDENKKNISKKVIPGYENFLDNQKHFPNFNNVGLVINHTSGIIKINQVMNKIDVNIENMNANIIFTPEHGLLNSFQAGEKVDDVGSYNIPVISLYGENRKPKMEQLENLDAVIFDIQDIGSRYYTYVSTMTEVMNACIKANIPFVVLDRPNPIGGAINGPLLDLNFSSFVGMHPIPIRHGMTIGELAYMINNEGWLENGLKVPLYVVKMTGWNREMFYNETGMNFIPPSPNIPDLNTAIMYAGMCLFEGTNISEGRGTDNPFMKIGAPWIDSKKLLIHIKKQKFEGVEFVLSTFIPQSIPGKSINPKYLSEKCYGIQFIIIDKKKIKPIEIALFIIDFISKNHKENFSFDKNNFIDNLYGSDILRKSINSKKTIDKIIEEWKPFNNEKYLLY